MLRDLTREHWLELLNLPCNCIPNVLILRGGRSLRTNYEVHRTYFDNVTEIKTSNGLFDDLCVGDLNGKSIAYASVYGAPMASEIVHIFGVLGTPLVIQTGYCGAIADEIEIGDLFFPTEAYRREGASQYYQPRSEFVAASINIQEVPGLDSIDDISIHSGKSSPLPHFLRREIVRSRCGTTRAIRQLTWRPQQRSQLPSISVWSESPFYAWEITLGASSPS